LYDAAGKGTEGVKSRIEKAIEFAKSEVKNVRKEKKKTKTSDTQDERNYWQGVAAKPQQDEDAGTLPNKVTTAKVLGAEVAATTEAAKRPPDEETGAAPVFMIAIALMPIIMRLAAKVKAWWENRGSLDTLRNAFEKLINSPIKDVHEKRQKEERLLEKILVRLDEEKESHPEDPGEAISFIKMCIGIAKKVEEKEYHIRTMAMDPSSMIIKVVDRCGLAGVETQLAGFFAKSNSLVPREVFEKCAQSTGSFKLFIDEYLGLVTDEGEGLDELLTKQARLDADYKTDYRVYGYVGSIVADNPALRDVLTERFFADGTSLAAQDVLLYMLEDDTEFLRSVISNLEIDRNIRFVAFGHALNRGLIAEEYFKDKDGDVRAQFVEPWQLFIMVLERRLHRLCMRCYF